MDTLYFTWIEKPVDIEQNLQLPQFALRGYVQNDCSQNYTGGAFPCLEIAFFLRRDIGYFLIQHYIPSLLVVILSWVSFWINVDASPARVSIGLLTVLTSTTQSTGVNASLPRVNYVKAIDVWMSACLVFVFAALVEYAMVNVYARRKFAQLRPNALGLPLVPLGTSASTTTTVTTVPPPLAASSAREVVQPVSDAPPRRPRLLPGIASLLLGLDVEQGPTPNTDMLGSGSRGPGGQRRSTASKTGTAAAAAAKQPDPYDGKRKARRIDSFARKLFPLSFLLFNVVYWLAYTLPSASDVDREGEIPIKTD